jgi:hypothetical protein
MQQSRSFWSITFLVSVLPHFVQYFIVYLCRFLKLPLTGWGLAKVAVLAIKLDTSTKVQI